MKKNLLFVFTFLFLAGISSLKAQLLYSNNVTNANGYFLGGGNANVTLDDVQLDPAALGAYDTINVTYVKVAVFIAPNTAQSTVSLYYSPVDPASTTVGNAPSTPILVSTLTLPAGGAAGQAGIAAFGDSVTTLFKIPKLIGKPFTGTQSFFIGLNFSKSYNSSTSLGCGWYLADVNNTNEDTLWQFTKFGTFIQAFNFQTQVPGLSATMYAEVFGTTSSALSVKFTSFNGIIQNNQSLLTWSTSSERNNKGFDVERSQDGQTFSSIGFVAGKGTTANSSNYTFSDDKLVSGNNYYRLKQVDLDGKSTYSSTIKLAFSKFDWAILGNGSNNKWMQLQLDKSSNVSVQIVSLSGKVMQTINKGTLGQGTYSIPLDLNNASAGMYVVRLLVNNQVYSKNIIK